MDLDHPAEPRLPGGSRPLVSIVTPSFNQAAYLADTLRSVAEQDYPHLEHIVIDGASSDGSVDMIRNWAEHHAVRWQSQLDGGQADAIRRGIELARGDVVAWLNSDDIYLDSGVISDVMVLFGRGALAVTGAGWYLTASGRRTKRIPVHPDRIGFQTLRYVDWILQPATFIRRDVLLKYPIDTSLHYAFDWELFARMSKDVAFVPFERDIAGYRVHPAGKTLSGAGRRHRELLDVTRRFNGRASAHYVLLLTLTTTHRIAEKLPRPLYMVVRGILSRLARLSHVVTNGSGVQY